MHLQNVSLPKTAISNNTYEDSKLVSAKQRFFSRDRKKNTFDRPSSERASLPGLPRTPHSTSKGWKEEFRSVGVTSH
ncbi:hypothetical protein JTE90_006146 [Oedothorax gibbosus]|uniref:Uncharacterized protein n=1 Tax=Oedothorax gibbosus TaxID=931172 RepID=A0AAV6TYA3_9ARAC|nr:hypothetical protein JTE90_006146 [Oedothorax gibbosus]